MTVLNIIIAALALNLLVLVWMVRHYHSEKLSKLSAFKTIITGFIANFFDTFGIGSFATIVAMRRLFGIMPDDVKLIGSMNIQAMVTALLQALIFLQLIDVDITTLIISVVMIALGGFLSGMVAVRINKKIVHKIMLMAFLVSGVLVLLSQLNIIQLTSNATAITGIRLVIFAVFMLVSGALPAFGVGYYSLVQISIFLFGVSPAIAFPIMATASAFQMPVTAMPFISHKKFYFKSTILIAIFGCIGVILAAPLIHMVSGHTLKWILLVVIIYNVVTLSRSKT